MSEKLSGQITVFLSMTLLMLLSLVFTLLESARSEGLRLRVQMAANSSIESVFAQYDRLLWDNYGLLFFMDRYGDAAELKEVAQKYAKKNSGSDWFEFSVKGVDTEKYVSATDDGGRVFERSVCDYMKKAGLAGVAAKLVKDMTEASEIVGTDAAEEFDLSGISEKAKEIDERISEAENDLQEREDSSVETLTPEMNESEEREKYEQLRTTYGDIKKKGLLMAVCDDVETLSENVFEAGEFPSSLSSSEKSKNSGIVSEDGLHEGALLNEYCLDHFDSYTDGDREFMELEYLICGKDSALANMSSAVKRLIALRFGLNFVYLLKDEEKDAEAEMIALIIAGWTCIEGIIKGVKLLVQMIWALTESVDDVRSLLAGERVPLLKDSGKLTLSQGSGGWNYKQYLRLLLYLTGREKVCYRAMDVIQTKIRQSEPAFTMKNCIYAARISLEAEASAMFPYLPGTIDYHMNQTGEYCYGDIFLGR